MPTKKFKLADADSVYNAKTPLRAVDEEAVERYAEELRDPEREHEFPTPVLYTVKPGGVRVIGDGWHIVLAAKLNADQHNGPKTIAVEEREGDWSEVIACCAKRNREGLRPVPLSREDVRNLIYNFTAQPKWNAASSREIAKELGIRSHNTVEKHRAPAFKGGKRLGKDQKFRRLPAPGRMAGGKGDHKSYTPVTVIDVLHRYAERLRLPLTELVDAASDEDANKTVKAGRIITIEDDSLYTDWRSKRGNASLVWCNPPFSTIDGRGAVGDFIEKATEQLYLGNVADVVMLLPFRITESWWADISRGWTILMVTQRLAFTRPDGKTKEMAIYQTPLEYMIAHKGLHVAEFIEVFGGYGSVIRKNTLTSGLEKFRTAEEQRRDDAEAEKLMKANPIADRAIRGAVDKMISIDDDSPEGKKRIANFNRMLKDGHRRDQEMRARVEASFNQARQAGSSKIATTADSWIEEVFRDLDYDDDLQSMQAVRRLREGRGRPLTPPETIQVANWVQRQRELRKRH